MSLSEIEKKELENMVRQFTNKNKKTASEIDRAMKASDQGLTVVLFRRRPDESVVTSTYQVTTTRDVMHMIWMIDDEPENGIRVYNQRDELIHSCGACDYV